jgi:uncharacterized protein (TIGR02271 family)
MQQAIIGVFESEREATSARQELLSEGFDSTNVRNATLADTQNDGEHEGGISGFFKNLFGTDDHPHVDQYSEALGRGHPVLLVQTQSEEEADRAKSIMESAGAFDVQERAEQWTNSEVPSSSGLESSGEDKQTIPVVEEQLQVGKREVEGGGARIYMRVTEKPVEETLDLREEQVIVERRPINRPASDADLAQSQERVFEVRTSREEPVVAKVAQVVEEVEIAKRTTHRKETVRDTVRKTDVEVRDNANSASRTSDQSRP